MESQALNGSRIRSRISLRRKSAEKSGYSIFSLFLRQNHTHMRTSNSLFGQNQAEKLQNSVFVCESATVLTFEQL